MTLEELRTEAAQPGSPLKDMVLLQKSRLSVQPVTEAAATRAEASGAGSIRGFGRTGNDTGTVTEADVDNAVGSAFGRTPKEA